MTPRQVISRVIHYARRTAWEVPINLLAASPACPRSVRFLIYRTAGLAIDPAAILAPCMYFQSRLIRIGAESFINRNVRFFGGKSPIVIGDGVEVAMGATFVTETHAVGPPSHRAGTWCTQSIAVGDGCWIGANVIVLPGVQIGSGCVIATGAVVTKDCLPNGLYAGVPARRMKDLPATAEGQIPFDHLSMSTAPGANRR